MSTPIVADRDQVFVQCGSKGEWKWKAMTPEVAAEKGFVGRIIRCSYCKNAAAQLDHLWPYHKELTACVKCSKKKPWLDAVDDGLGITP